MQTPREKYRRIACFRIQQKRRLRTCFYFLADIKFAFCYRGADQRFDVPLLVRDDAVELLAMHYKNGKKDLNAARLRMARIPEGASLIENKVSGAPGFVIKNVEL